MYEAMRLASLVSKVQGPDWQQWLGTDEALRAATEGSARALGLHKQIGKIAPGYKADIVFLDLHHINWIPTNDPVNGIVHTEDGTGVHSVMIGGRMIVENRKLLTVDLPKLAAKVEASRVRRAKSPRRRRSSTSSWRRSSAPSVPGWPRRRCTSIATARVITRLSVSRLDGRASLLGARHCTLSNLRAKRRVLSCSFGPRASGSLMIMSEPEARGPDRS